VLQWARANNCPWNKRECEEASWRKHPETYAWVRQQEKEEDDDEDDEEEEEADEVEEEEEDDAEQEAV